MCGFCGVYFKDTSRKTDQRLIQKMADTLHHRGPDDSGEYIDNNLGLGFRRLSIIDLAGGHQPMSNDDGSIWIVYNGEIYNHLEIRYTLQGKRYSYRTKCDTESVIHAYEEYGKDCVNHLRGMFAFIIYDRNRRRLFAARDRLGIKPFYYHDCKDYLAFGSEIKSLLAFDEIPRELNIDSLAEQMALKYTLDDQTLFKGIKKLMPGHTLTLENGSIEIRKYWDIDFQDYDSRRSEQRYIEQFHELFEESVKMRLMSDVPLGMFLSGGIDSSAVAACMSRMVGQPIKTFSAAFAERAYNELEYSRLSAEQCGAECHEITITPNQFFSELPHLIFQEDEPIAHPSSVALYFVARLARDHVKVVLTGEGSDELLGGYERYYQTLYNLKAGRILDLPIFKPVKRYLLKPIIDFLPDRFPYKNKAVRTAVYLENDLDTIFLDNYSTFSRQMQSSLYSPKVFNGFNFKNLYQNYHSIYGNCNSELLLNKLLYADLKTYLLELLMKQDQMSMAASIESRVPFLDHRLVEFTASLPVSMKIKGLNTKRILRKAMEGKIPDPILSRSKKGFPVPIEKWFRHDHKMVVTDILFDERTRKRGIFNQKAVEHIVRKHEIGVRNYSDQIWTLINFELWQRIFLEREDYSSIQLL
ncbi:MAG: asparagine synthase (glutamine-hydrolyzing) [candidate division Zixibacteria bacterium]|nr:asparagine synthase (glutamine-hydrolyzing) [candidate division Zixibacteria bacterium]NIR66463.1 asparagine synthase (glutamine-hydrolyzing) [candidate division Zixibacteria bacterium]NIS18160.1 asparagine synthase (glutamine-hydrolyzing) [candidate division Zixibacteria bacterium]NIS48051.1 asparagine synthase (glutamine-hydrolyzing) [candidate division Zixibacteria bacterium]NIT54433.1 asparagine synthase (glutamine-hydrolyzing) [candidate division Zixibacteria bacterium]